MPGYSYRHYFAQLAPAVALAAGQGFAVLLGRAGNSFARSGLAIGCGLVSLAVPVTVNRQYFLETDPNAISRHYFGINPFPESKPVADFLAQNTEPEDRVLIVGSEPQILFYAERQSPSSFIMMYPLMLAHPRYKEFQHQMLAEVERTPPRYIVALVGIPGTFAWDQIADVKILRDLEALINEKYTLQRLRLVSGSNGEWIDAGDRGIRPEMPLIYIFRRKP
jgi:hypothetical protein